MYDARERRTPMKTHFSLHRKQKPTRETNMNETTGYKNSVHLQRAELCEKRKGAKSFPHLMHCQLNNESWPNKVVLWFFSLNVIKAIKSMRFDQMLIDIETWRNLNFEDIFKSFFTKIDFFE